MTSLQPHLPGIILAYSTFVLATVSPGPALLATMGTSMSEGRRRGVVLGLGIVTGSFCWALLAAAGLSLLLSTYAGALDVIRIAGGLYLLWLAFKALRSAASQHPMVVTHRGGASTSARSYFVRGWAIHMTNPKAIFAWIAIISLSVTPASPVWVIATIVVGTTMFGAAFYTACAIAFSTRVMVKAYGRARRWIEGVLGAFFTFAGCKLLAS